MKEFRFKVLEEGDALESFSEKRMIIKKKNGDYHIYKVNGFSEGCPTFDRNFRLVINRGLGRLKRLTPKQK